MTVQATVLDPGAGRPIWQLGNEFTLKAAGEQTDGRFAILEQVCAGAPPPLHVHDNEEETFYVLDGTLDLSVGNDVHHVSTGSFCVVPRGVPHTFISTSPQPARLLVIVSPPGFEEFFAACEERFPAGAGMPEPEVVGPALDALARRHGCRIVGPPPA